MIIIMIIIIFIVYVIIINICVSLWILQAYLSTILNFSLLVHKSSFTRSHCFLSLSVCVFVPVCDVGVCIFGWGVV